MKDPTPDEARRRAFRTHSRSLDQTRFAYAVLSRRAGGISIGVNLNPSKQCNFDCVYCQVDRSVPPRDRKVDLPVLEQELVRLLRSVRDGSLYRHEPFRAIPDRLRRPVDIAFSGNGEPTTAPCFGEAVDLVLRVRREAQREDLPIRLLTNASGLDRPAVRAALDRLARGPFEIWGKLDAGTAEFYRRVNRSRVPFDRILLNLAGAARRYPLSIQSLFLRMHGVLPAEAEIGAWIDRLRDIRSSGGRIASVQVYTVARRPAEEWVAPLSRGELETIAARAAEAGFDVRVHPSAGES